MHGEKIIKSVKLANCLNIKKIVTVPVALFIILQFLTQIKKSFPFFVLKKKTKISTSYFQFFFFNIKNAEFFYFYIEL